MSAHLRSASVLHVNDDAARRYLLGRILRDHGFAVIDASTGAEGLELAASKHPEIVLLDVKLPDIDGFDVCRRLKAEPATASIPVVLVSAVLVEDADKVYGLESGADGYLTDPLHPSVVVATLRALLRARAAEEARRESEAQYRLLFEHNPLPAWVFELGTLRILAVNEAATRQYGYTAEQFLGMTLAALVPEGDEQGVSALLQPDARVRHRRQNGSVIDVELTSQTIPYGGAAARLVIAHDVTARRRAEARLATQLAVTRVVAEAATVGEAVPRLVEALGEPLGWDVVELWRAGSDGHLRLSGFWQRAGVDAHALEAAGRELSTANTCDVPLGVWTAAEAVWFSDLTADARFRRRRAAAEAELHGAIACPVHHGGQLIGAMLFLTRRTDLPDPALLDMLADIGKQIGNFVRRKRFEEELRLAEGRYRLALKSSRGLVWEWDPTTDNVDWDGDVDTVFGHPVVEARRGLDFWSVQLHPEDRERVLANLREALAGPEELWADECRVRGADGAYRQVSSHGCIVRNDSGKPVRVIGAVLDVTERAVREQRDRLRALALTSMHVREDEARRIAHELHDEAGQLLAAVHIALDKIRRDAKHPGFKEVDELLAMAEEHLRQLAYELRPKILDDLGLRPALEMMAERMLVRSGLQVKVEAPDRRLPLLVETALYRIAQEAVTNAVRHGRSRTVSIRIDVDPSTVRCAIRDDGSGFDPQRLGSGAGLGLVGARERAEALGGTLEITSSRRRGTELRIMMPLTADDGAPRPAR